MAVSWMACLPTLNKSIKLIVKRINSHFVDFAQVKELVVILLTFGKSNELTVIFLTLKRSKKLVVILLPLGKLSCFLDGCFRSLVFAKLPQEKLDA